MNRDGSVQVIVDPQDLTYVSLTEKLLDRQSITTISSSATRARAYSDPEAEFTLLVTEPQTTASLAFTGRAYSRYSLKPSVATQVYNSNVTGGTWNYDTFGVSGDNVGFTPKLTHDFKYVNVVAGIGSYYARHCIFRMEEVLLSRAEAYAMLGDYNSALFDLNMYIQRRISSFDYKTHMLTRDKIVDYYQDRIKLQGHFLSSAFNANAFSQPVTTYEGLLQRALILTILDFRRSEYIAEGLRYFDILRWNIPVEHTTNSGEVITINPDDPRRVVQVPESSVLSNVKQNIWQEMDLSQPLVKMSKEDYLEGITDDE